MRVFRRHASLAMPALTALTALALVLASPVAAARPLEPSTELVSYRPTRVGSIQVRWVTFTNRTRAAVVFGPVAIFAVGPAAFALHGDTCGDEIVELPPGGSCAYGIAFTPKAAGRFQARLVYVVAGGRPPATVELRGRAG
jgi:hypothetical protein